MAMKPSANDLRFGSNPGLNGIAGWADEDMGVYSSPLQSTDLAMMGHSAAFNINRAMEGMGSGKGLRLNLPTLNLALNGIGTIGSLWAAFKGLGLAKEQFNYQKNVTDTNLANTIKSYNTSLADRARSRAFTEGRPQSEADDYVAKNSMTRQPM